MLTKFNLYLTMIIISKYETINLLRIYRSYKHYNNNSLILDLLILYTKN